MREDIPTPLPAGPATFSATPHWFDFYTADRKTAPRTAPPITTGRTTTAPPKTQKGHSKPANPWKHWVSLICIVQSTSAAACCCPLLPGQLPGLPPLPAADAPPLPDCPLPPIHPRSLSQGPDLLSQSPDLLSTFSYTSRVFFMLLTLVLLPYPLLSPVGRTAPFSSTLPVTW